MKQKFTQNLLVRYLYKETTAAETMMVADALYEDRRLYEQFEDLLESKNQLPEVRFTPSASAIQNILRYSEQSAVETPH
ncbi:MAG: hypothetical protein AAGG75_20090 [Bacteroidota bacterium]